MVDAVDLLSATCFERHCYLQQQSAWFCFEDAMVCCTSESWLVVIAQDATFSTLRLWLGCSGTRVRPRRKGMPCPLQPVLAY